MDVTSGFLDDRLCVEFRNVISSSPIFCHAPEYLSKYNLCCAVMDRLDTCVFILNKYGSYPNTEEDFVTFMMFACMVTDAVKEIADTLCTNTNKSAKSNNDCCFFKDTYIQSPIYNPNSEIPTDDKFFEYLRSLIFAHPFETSRAKFLKKGEKQYSPWVIVNRSIAGFRDIKDAVGVRIYSSHSDGIIDLRISFALLKKYINSRYKMIKSATESVKVLINAANDKWKKVKVDREQSAVIILQEIVAILKARYENSDLITELCSYMICTLSLKSNKEAVNEYRSAICTVIPHMCDAVEDMDYERLANLCGGLLKYPKVMHEMANYQLEKIFGYLNEKINSRYLLTVRNGGSFKPNPFQKGLLRNR